MSTKLAQAADNVDSRYTIAGFIRPQLNKVFPSHWSFMLGEMALYSFIILLLTGIYLALFFDCLLYTSPSPRDVEESRMPSSA